MSALKQEQVTRRTAVPGFTGVGTVYSDRAGDVVVVAADAEALAARLKEFMPAEKIAAELFQPMTIIPAK